VQRRVLTLTRGICTFHFLAVGRNKSSPHVQIVRQFMNATERCSSAQNQTTTEVDVESSASRKGIFALRFGIAGHTMLFKHFRHYGRPQTFLVPRCLESVLSVAIDICSVDV
jgi:hypothetical protein